MPPLTWRNVDQPSFADANNMFRTAADLMNTGAEAAQKGIATFRQTTTDEQSAKLMQDIAAAGNDPAAIQAAIAGANSAFLTPDALRFANAQEGVLNARQGQVINNEGGRIANTQGNQAIEANTFDMGVARRDDATAQTKVAAQTAMAPVIAEANRLALTDPAAAEAYIAPYADQLTAAGEDITTLRSGFRTGMEGQRDNVTEDRTYAEGEVKRANITSGSDLLQQVLKANPGADKITIQQKLNDLSGAEGVNLDALAEARTAAEAYTGYGNQGNTQRDKDRQAMGLEPLPTAAPDNSWASDWIKANPSAPVNPAPVAGAPASVSPSGVVAPAAPAILPPLPSSTLGTPNADAASAVLGTVAAQPAGGTSSAPGYTGPGDAYVDPSFPEGASTTLPTAAPKTVVPPAYNPTIQGAAPAQQYALPPNSVRDPNAPAAAQADQILAAAVPPTPAPAAARPAAPVAPAAAPVAAGAPPSSSPIAQTDNPVFNGFMGEVSKVITNPYGLAVVHAYGKHESGFSAKNATGSWSDPSESGQNGTSGGVMSWRADRFENMRANGTDPAAQGRFFLNENPQLITALNNATSVEEANQLMANAWRFAGFDRPGGENGARLSTAQGLLPAYMNGEVPPVGQAGGEGQRYTTATAERQATGPTNANAALMDETGVNPLGPRGMDDILAEGGPTTARSRMEQTTGLGNVADVDAALGTPQASVEGDLPGNPNAPVTTNVPDKEYTDADRVMANLNANAANESFGASRVPNAGGAPPASAAATGAVPTVQQTIKDSFPKVDPKASGFAQSTQKAQRDQAINTAIQQLVQKTMMVGGGPSNGLVDGIGRGWDYFFSGSEQSATNEANRQNTSDSVSLYRENAEWFRENPAELEKALADPVAYADDWGTTTSQKSYLAAKDAPAAAGPANVTGTAPSDPATVPPAEGGSLAAEPEYRLVVDPTDGQTVRKELVTAAGPEEKTPGQLLNDTRAAMLAPPKAYDREDPNEEAMISESADRDADYVYQALTTANQLDETTSMFGRLDAAQMALSTGTARDRFTVEGALFEEVSKVNSDITSGDVVDWFKEMSEAGITNPEMAYQILKEASGTTGGGFLQGDKKSTIDIDYAKEIASAYLGKDEFGDTTTGPSYRAQMRIQDKAEAVAQLDTIKAQADEMKARYEALLKSPDYNETRDGTRGEIKEMLLEIDAYAKREFAKVEATGIFRPPTPVKKTGS